MSCRWSTPHKYRGKIPGSRASDYAEHYARPTTADIRPSVAEQPRTAEIPIKSASRAKKPQTSENHCTQPPRRCHQASLLPPRRFYTTKSLQSFDLDMRGRHVTLVPHGLLTLPSPFCIALNRSRGRRQEGVEPLSYDGVAFAGCLFEAGTIHYLNRPPTIADKAGRLH